MPPRVVPFTRLGSPFPGERKYGRPGERESLTCPIYGRPISFSRSKNSTQRKVFVQECQEPVLIACVLSFFYLRKGIPLPVLGREWERITAHRFTGEQRSRSTVRVDPAVAQFTSWLWTERTRESTLVRRLNRIVSVCILCVEQRRSSVILPKRSKCLTIEEF